MERCVQAPIATRRSGCASGAARDRRGVRLAGLGLRWPEMTRDREMRRVRLAGARGGGGVSTHTSKPSSAALLRSASTPTHTEMHLSQACQPRPLSSPTPLTLLPPPPSSPPSLPPSFSHPPGAGTTPRIPTPPPPLSRRRSPAGWSGPTRRWRPHEAAREAARAVWLGVRPHNALCTGPRRRLGKYLCRRAWADLGPRSGRTVRYSEYRESTCRRWVMGDR